MALEGNLNYRELADLLKVVDMSSKTGILNIAAPEGEGRLFFEEGKLIRAESNRFSVRVGDVLIERKVLTPEDVQRALDIQIKEGGKRKLGAVICEEMSVPVILIEGALNSQFKAVVSDILSWPEGHIRFDIVSEPRSKERFLLNAAEFILAVGIEAGYLAETGTANP
jgi:hypothetical protein